jgi:predicted TIM-barrel fold metal-dependent hydrolase
MVASGHTVVDTDAHYYDTLDDIARYLDEPWRSRFQTKIDSPQASIFPGSTGDRDVYGRIQRDDLSMSDMTPAEIIQVMGEIGVDKTVLLSQKMLSFARIGGGDERPVLLANGYTDYMLDQVVDPAEGVYTMAPVPYQHPRKAAELVDRVGDERGIVGFCMVTPGAEPPLGNAKYDVIYEAIEDTGLPVVFHAGGGGLDEFHIKGFERFIETHTLGFLVNNMAQLTSLVVRGVPEKFPDIDLVFQESGLFWVPTMMNRLDAEYLKRPSEAPLLKKRPSEYMKEFYYGIQPLEKPVDPTHLEQIVAMIGGPDQLLYASDYPHWDYDPPSAITEIGFLTDAEKGAILGGNATAVFDL